MSAGVMNNRVGRPCCMNSAPSWCGSLFLSEAKTLISPSVLYLKNILQGTYRFLHLILQKIGTVSTSSITEGNDSEISL